MPKLPPRNATHQRQPVSPLYQNAPTRIHTRKTLMIDPVSWLIAVALVLGVAWAWQKNAMRHKSWTRAEELERRKERRLQAAVRQI